MKRLSRYLAAWAITRHHLALDAIELADERDEWMVKAFSAIHHAERAIAAAHRFQAELGRSRAEVQSLADTLDDLMEVEDIAW